MQFLILLNGRKGPRRKTQMLRVQGKYLAVHNGMTTPPMFPASTFCTDDWGLNTGLYRQSAWSSENRIQGSEDRAWGLVSNKKGQSWFRKWFPLSESEFVWSGWEYTFWYQRQSVQILALPFTRQVTYQNPSLLSVKWGWWKPASWVYCKDSMMIHWKKLAWCSVHCKHVIPLIIHD